jgi:hypothetical protein
MPLPYGYTCNAVVCLGKDQGCIFFWLDVRGRGVEELGAFFSPFLLVAVEWR